MQNFVTIQIVVLISFVALIVCHCYRIKFKIMKSLYLRKLEIIESLQNHVIVLIIYITQSEQLIHNNTIYSSHLGGNVGLGLLDDNNVGC